MMTDSASSAEQLDPSHRISRRLVPVGVLALSLSLIVYAAVRSSAWIDSAFPGFFLMNNAVVPTVSTFDWPSDRNALFHARVVAVDGRSVRRSADVYRYTAEKPIGTNIAYSFRRDGEVWQATLSTRRFGLSDYVQTFGVMLVFGAAWLVFGVVVAFLQPDKPQSRVFVFQSLVAGLYPISGVFLYQGDLEWLSRFYFLLECLFPATWIHLALVFPVDRKIRGPLVGVPLLAYGASLAYASVVLRGMSSDPVDLGPLHNIYLYSGASMLLFLANLAIQFRKHDEPLVRARIKAVLPGAMAAGAIACFAITNSAMTTRDFPVQFGLLFTPLFSAGVAYAIANHELFDVDRVVRISFAYFLLSLAVLGGYALTVSFAPPVILGEGTSSLQFLLFLALAFCLDPLRRLIQRAVDRAFYRGRPSYRKTIGDLSEAMTSLLDTKEIVDQLTTVVANSMGLESAAVVLFDPTGVKPRPWRRNPDGELEEIRSPGTTRSSSSEQEFDDGALNRGLLDRTNPQQQRAIGDLLDGAPVELAVPIVFREETLGAVLLGRRLSGRPFSADDRALLRALANQTAVALHNARSFEALEDLSRNLDAKVSQQTEALRSSNRELRAAYDQLKRAQSQLLQSEKLASLGRLVAGVAHELNNPASFVHGGIENLTRYVQRLTRMIEAYEAAPSSDPSAAAELAAVREEVGLDYLLRETPNLLRICSEGSERIKKIVEDLRIFARSDRGDRAPTQVAEGIESTLRLLGNRIAAEHVQVITNFEEVPAVQADSPQLNQVWMNLIDNALDAMKSSGDPTLEVTVRRRPDGSPVSAESIEVTFADNGDGIAPSHLAEIFEPFFTTKPVGAGTGLGLAIAYGAVRSHGGTIKVDTKLGRGTAFTVHLPTNRD